MVATINYAQLLPAGTEASQLQPRLLEIRPRWLNAQLEYLGASLGESALAAEKDLALATTQVLADLPELSEGRFVIIHQPQSIKGKDGCRHLSIH